MGNQERSCRYSLLHSWSLIVTFLGMVLLDNNYWYQTTSKNVDESNKGASVSLSMALVPLLLEELASSLITTGADEWVKLSHTSEYVLLFFVDTVIITNEVWIE